MDKMNLIYQKEQKVLLGGIAIWLTISIFLILYAIINQAEDKKTLLLIAGIGPFVAWDIVFGFVAWRLSVIRQMDINQLNDKGSGGYYGFFKKFWPHLCLLQGVTLVVFFFNAVTFIIATPIILFSAMWLVPSVKVNKSCHSH